MLILINLESAHGRRASMEAQLRSAGLAAQRVGIDLRGVARADAREMARRAFPAFRFGGLLSGPEIGCWLSHLTAWQPRDRGPRPGLHGDRGRHRPAAALR